MIPSKIMIVENNVSRIRQMLETIREDASSGELGLLPQHHDGAATILEKCTQENPGHESDFLLGRYEPSPSHSVVVVWVRKDESDFKRVDLILDQCADACAICYLDLHLDNNNLDELAQLEFDNANISWVHSTLAAGARIGEKFGRTFGRLLVQASGVSGGEGYSPANNSHYCDTIPWVADTSQAASKLLADSLKEYRVRYGLHPGAGDKPGVRAISEFLWLFFRGFSEKWDCSEEIRPFTHDPLQGTGRCLREIECFLYGAAECESRIEMGQSPKGLFWIEGDTKSSKDCRDVSPKVLDASLWRLGIDARIVTDTGVLWRFPFKPAISLLMSLRNFLFRCSGDGGSQIGEIPSVTLRGGHSLRAGKNCFVGRIELDFGCIEGGCEDLISEFLDRSENRTKEPEQVGSISQALYYVLAAQVCVKKACGCPEFQAFSSPLDSLLSFQGDNTKMTVMWEIEL